MMKGVFLRILAWALILGLGLWDSGVPLTWAQLEITPEIRQACEQFSPELREVALNEIVPAIESNPEGPEAKTVETTAVAIAEATQTAKQAVENPDAVTKGAMEALAANGVPAEVVAKVEAQMREALVKVKETFAKGGSLEDVSKYFETCQKAMGECSAYLGGKDVREVFAAAGGPTGTERAGEFRSIEFLGSVVDPAQKDIIGGCLEAHFREVALRGGGPETLGAPSPEVMEKMMASGVSMEAVFRGMEGQIPEAQMREMAAQMETHMKEMGAMMEAQYKEMGAAMEVQYREVLEKIRTENPNLDSTQQSKFETQQQTLTQQQTQQTLTETDGHAKCPTGTTHQPGALEGPGHCM